MVSDGMTNREILEAHPDLELEDVQEALKFAAEAGGFPFPFVRKRKKEKRSS
jgi:uncharacterized protein (DUF433 family)